MKNVFGAGSAAGAEIRDPIFGCMNDIFILMVGFEPHSAEHGNLPTLDSIIRSLQK